MGLGLRPAVGMRGARLIGPLLRIDSCPQIHVSESLVPQNGAVPVGSGCPDELHRLGGLNHAHLFLSVLEAGMPEIEVPGLQTPCPREAEREGDLRVPPLQVRTPVLLWGPPARRHLTLTRLEARKTHPVGDLTWKWGLCRGNWLSQDEVALEEAA